MDTEIDYKSLAELTFKSLCRVLKKRKIYHHFRCFIGYSKKSKYDYLIPNDLVGAVYCALNSNNKYRSTATSFKRGNSFTFVTTKEELYKTLADIQGYNCRDKLKIKDANKVQTCITQFLNNMLHCTIEHLICDFKKLEDIGREAFETACKKIYGDDFVDETEKGVPENLEAVIGNLNDLYNNNDMNRLLEMFRNKLVTDVDYYRGTYNEYDTTSNATYGNVINDFNIDDDYFNIDDD